MKNFLFFYFFLIYIVPINAQDKCGTMSYHEMMKIQYPEFESNLNQIEQFTQQYIHLNEGLSDRNLITIPVVFHVVYRTADQNISDAQIQSQLDIINEDYRKLNADFSTTPSVFQGVAADFEIQFCLASKDPQGNPTTGITRRQTNVNAFSQSNAVKFNSQGGTDAWPRDRYLNVWICNLTGTLLGYAQFPGGPANTDGVVVTYTSVGRPPFNTFQTNYNLGRTLTHEIGHWLNLRHIWADEDNCTATDFVEDTPVQFSSNSGCPTHPSSSCNNGGDMFMNYMDYCFDLCLTMFTNGQKQRARALFTTGGARVTLLNSQACENVIIPPTTCGDTLKFPLIGTPVLYFDSELGYFSGSNIFEDKAKAERFSVNNTSQVSGGLFYFGIAESSNSNLPITIKLWNGNGPNGSPGTVLAQTTVPISLINQAINANSYLIINFPNPVTVNGVFYLGFDVPPINTATIALVTNSDGNSNPNTAWEQLSDNNWIAYSANNSWAISVSHAVSALILPPLPSANFSVIGSPICAGQSVTYQPNSAGLQAYNWTFPGGNPSSSTAQSPTITYPSSGNFSATLSVQSQCFTEPFTQTNNNLVSVNVVPNVPTIFQQNANLISSASQGNQWFLNGVAIPGATTQIYTPNQSGNYTVEVSNGNCKSTSAVLNFTFVSVSEVDNFGVAFYPNPSDNLLNISVSEGVPVFFTMYDISGKQVIESQQLNQGQHIISLKNYNIRVGMYLIKFERNHQYTTKRLVYMQ